jgi:hypothetical protein
LWLVALLSLSQVNLNELAVILTRLDAFWIAFDVADTNVCAYWLLGDDIPTSTVNVLTVAYAIDTQLSYLGSDLLG